MLHHGVGGTCILGELHPHSKGANTKNGKIHSWSQINFGIKTQTQDASSPTVEDIQAIMAQINLSNYQMYFILPSWKLGGCLHHGP